MLHLHQVVLPGNRSVRHASWQSACSLNGDVLCALLQVACTDKNFRQNPQRTQPQPDLLADMAHAHFCLVMPGNVQSSGHLADAFFTGCIPVFLGPPFHTLPIPHLVSFITSIAR